MLLSDTCSIRSGLTLRERLSGAPDGGVLAVQQGDILPSGGFSLEKAVRMNAPTQSPHRIRPHELVFRSRGPFWSAWAPGDFGEPLVAIAPLFILTPTSDIDPSYLAWFIGRPAAQRYFATESMGTGVKMISRSVLEKLPVEIPPFKAQRAIVDAAALLTRERALTDRLTSLRHDLVSKGLDYAASRHTNMGIRRSLR